MAKVKRKGSPRKGSPRPRREGARRSSPPPPEPSEGQRHRLHDLAGIVLMTGGALIGASLLLENSGMVTQHIVAGLRQGVGQGALLVPLGLLLYGLLLLWKGGQLRPPSTSLSALLLFLAILGFLHLRCPVGEEVAQAERYGGYLGAGLALLLRRAVGQVGGYIVLVALGVASWVLAGEEPVAERWGRWRQRWAAWRSARKPAPSRPRPRLRKEKPAPTPIPQPPPPEAKPPAEEMAEPEVPPPSLPLERESREAVFPLPPLELIEPDYREPSPDREEEIRENIQRLEQVLASFGVEAKVVHVSRGPAVTRYEITLAPGVRVHRVVNLADDLTLALAAHDVRVEAPVPGKGVVGIEVPNREVEIVHLVDLISTGEFQRARSKLTFALGRDIAGNPQFADLARMPHLLIGGATNSGKSVCLNSLIVSILYKASPREVRFLMIDPKRVELTLFNGIPHLDRPVVTEAKEAADLLRGAIREMELRYQMFAERGVRHITSYNRKVPPEERLAYIVIIIDELADLMMQASAEFEACICRIAQLARATGIHLVIATQRPSVNVITGTIKANIPSRIAFAVASQVDSRTIIDMVGAERLIGRGDMLYYPIDASKPIRIQGAFVDEEQVRRLVAYLKRAKEEMHYEVVPILEPVAADQMPEMRFGSPPEEEEEIEDELFEEAVKLVLAEGQASTSRLQRKFSIGYNRAGRLIDLMEARGIVGPAEGSKPRKVLISSMAEFYRLYRPARPSGHPSEEEE